MTTDTVRALRPRPEPLPATREAMLARKTMPGMTLNDYVDAVHTALYMVDSTYTAYLDAVYDSDAVEGSVRIDNAKAAECIRQYAIDNDIAYIKTKKLATLSRSLNVVLKRYKIGRKQRANTVGGQIVPNDNSDE